MAPIGYAVKGGPLAVDLWRYKSGGAGAAESAGRLRAMLANYLELQGESLWAAAGMGVGPQAGPEAGGPGREPSRWCRAGRGGRAVIRWSAWCARALTFPW